MRFVLPIICIVTFLLVSVMVVDAVAPFGLVLPSALRDTSIPTAVRILLVLPFACALASSFVPHKFARGIVMALSVALLTLLWIVGLILLVVYPMPDTQVSYALTAITSIPFVFAVIATMTHSVRTILAAAGNPLFERARPNKSLDASGGSASRN